MLPALLQIKEVKMSNFWSKFKSLNWRKGIFRLSVILSVISGIVGGFVVYEIHGGAEYPVLKIPYFLLGVVGGLVGIWMTYGILYLCYWLLKFLINWIWQGLSDNES